MNEYNVALSLPLLSKAPMTNAEAAKIITEYFDIDDMLECFRRYENVGQPHPSQIRVAYFTLMASFTHLVG